MRIIFLYIILVGVMLVVLLKIIRIGENIKAPQDVSGDWKIKNEFVSSIQGNCAAIAFNKRNPKLNIEQSGKYLELKLSDSSNTVMNGKLENDSLKFECIIPAKKDINNLFRSEIKVRLSLKLINHKNSPNEISGLWSIINCSNCKPISFAAIKENNEQ